MSIRTCAFDACPNPLRSKGYCEAHYTQLRRGRTLTPSKPKPPPPSERYEQSVDRGGECWEWTGRKDARGYGIFFADGRDRPAHRQALALAGVAVPGGMVVDHLCHTLSCVRPSHLRVVTQQENAHNIEGLHSSNTSGYRGVSRNGSGWIARVRLDGTLRTLGTYRTAQEAGRVAADYRTRHMGVWDSVAQSEWRVTA